MQLLYCHRRYLIISQIVCSKREIVAANFMMHEVHCRRNISLCTRCGEPVPMIEMETHFEENHSEVECDLCRGNVEKLYLTQHKVGKMHSHFFF